MPFLALQASCEQRVNFLWLSGPHEEGYTATLNSNLFNIPFGPPRPCQLAWLCQTASSQIIEEALGSWGLDDKQSWGLYG